MIKFQDGHVARGVPTDQTVGIGDDNIVAVKEHRVVAAEQRDVVGDQGRRIKVAREGDLQRLQRIREHMRAGSDRNIGDRWPVNETADIHAPSGTHPIQVHLVAAARLLVLNPNLVRTGVQSRRQLTRQQWLITSPSVVKQLVRFKRSITIQINPKTAAIVAACQQLNSVLGYNDISIPLDGEIVPIVVAGSAGNSHGRADANSERRNETFGIDTRARDLLCRPPVQLVHGAQTLIDVTAGQTGARQSCIGEQIRFGHTAGTVTGSNSRTS